MIRAKRITGRHTELRRMEWDLPRIDQRPIRLKNLGGHVPHFTTARFAATTHRFTDGTAFRSNNKGHVLATKGGDNGNNVVPNAVRLIFMQNETIRSSLHIILNTRSYSEAAITTLRRLKEDRIIDGTAYREACQRVEGRGWAISSSPLRFVIQIIERNRQLLEWLASSHPEATQALEYLDSHPEVKRPRIIQKSMPPKPDQAGLATALKERMNRFAPASDNSIIPQLLAIKWDINSSPITGETAKELRQTYDLLLKATYLRVRSTPIRNELGSKVERQLILIQLITERYMPDIMAAYDLATCVFDIFDGLTPRDMTAGLTRLRTDFEELFRRINEQMRDAGLLPKDPEASSIITSNFGGGGEGGRSGAVLRNRSLSERERNFN